MIRKTNETDVSPTVDRLAVWEALLQRLASLGRDSRSAPRAASRWAVAAVVLMTTAWLAPASTVMADERVPDGVSPSDWSSIRAAYEANRHAAFAVDGGYDARNPGQRWQTHFDGRAFLATPDSGHWTWGLELVSYGPAGAERPMNAPASIAAVGGRVHYAWDASLTEWYINDLRGLEHGYTVHQPPALERSCAAGDGLRFTLAVRGGLAARVSGDGRDVTFVDAHGASVVNYRGLTAFDADGVVLPATFEFRLGASTGAGTRATDVLLLKVDDRMARYPLTIDPVAQQAYLKASNTGADDQFGTDVAVSGDTVVVGASREDSNATGVNGNQANNSLTNAGAAYVFVRSGMSWTQQAYLKASNSDSNDEFGRAVAVSGDTLVIGAYGEDSNATGINGNQADNSLVNPGAAYVFVRNGTTWSQQAYLKASNTGEFDFFALSVAVSGDTVVVGAENEDSNATGVNGNQANNSASGAGAAYVFVRSGTTWTQQAYVKASNTNAGDIFGSSVSVSGGTLVVGANLEDSNAVGVNGNQSDNSTNGAGAAYVFVRSGSTWSQQAYIKASNTGAADQFGRAVAMSGDTVVVGAFSEASNATGVNGNQANESASGAGAAYVFVRNGASWSQQAYLKASNTDVSDSFGWSVAVSGDTVVVGANGESSNATGVGGDQANNGASDAGAAYVFVRSGATWMQQAYLKASNTGASDSFGTSVAVSGGTVVVGANGEDSNATGVNGVQANNSVSASGAAYLYFIPPSMDCNGNGVPDELELAGNDCNGNGVPDDCESGVSCCLGDMNGDGIVNGADLAIVLGSWGICPR